MVDSIKGHGDKTIIITKPKAKEPPDKAREGSFESTLKGKGGADGTDASGATRVRGNVEAKIAVLQQQNLSRFQRLEEITRQIQNGTYKMVDPAVLAERLLKVFQDKKTRGKFLRKMVEEDLEKSKPKDRNLSPLELKKLVFMIKSAPEEVFSDEDLEALLKDLT